ncbi:hypothetical protein [Flavobacterium aquidurense]|uniref:DUF3300 domain containing protein n=1 Tax=Flavobacterium aquidurense TaxID=362413 RepID=A0A0Q0W7M5_9FLAO|nr:hypothetical protein [Flavobacterium aquidurense]KQB42491.1 hypothetical protein RC62_3498 [Flavobacterium aquidurense]
MISKNFLFSLATVCLLGQSIFSQNINDTPSLGLPGDNLDLYAVLDLFQKSKTIEDFEKSLNDKNSGINNLDLDLDKKVDFIKVTSKSEGSDFTFVLQDPVSKTETQDIAVILVDKDKSGKVNLQIVGDEDLYGKNYVIEPKTTATAAVTANPAYSGSDPAKSAPASQAVVVEKVPVVQYIYSPAYVPYYPPYYYGYYPPYYIPFAAISVAVYAHHHYHHHHHYYGGHYGGGGTVIIHNKNVYNNYNINRSRSNTVVTNRESGKYRTAANSSNRQQARSSEQRSSKYNKGASTQTRKHSQASNRPAKNYSQPQRSSALKTTPHAAVKRPVRSKM